MKINKDRRFYFIIATILLASSLLFSTLASAQSFWDQDNLGDGTYEMNGFADLARMGCYNKDRFTQGLWDTVLGPPCWWLDGGLNIDYTPNILQLLLGYYNVLAITMGVFFFLIGVLKGNVNLTTLKDKDGWNLSNYTLSGVLILATLLPVEGPMGHYSVGQHFIHQLANIGLGSAEYLSKKGGDFIVSGTPLYHAPQAPDRIIIDNLKMAQLLVCANTINPSSNVMAYYVNEDGSRGTISKGESFRAAMGSRRIEFGDMAGQTICGNLDLMPNSAGGILLQWASDFNKSDYKLRANEVAKEQIAIAYVEHLDRMMQLADQLNNSHMKSNATRLADMLVHGDSATAQAYELAMLAYTAFLKEFNESINEKARTIHSVMDDGTAQFMENYKENITFSNWPLALYQSGDLNSSIKSLIENNLPTVSVNPLSCKVDSAEGGMFSWIKGSQERFCEQVNASNNSKAVVIDIHESAIESMRVGKLPVGNLEKALSNNFGCQGNQCTPEKASNSAMHLVTSKTLEALQMLGGADPHSPPIQRIQATGEILIRAAGLSYTMEIALTSLARGSEGSVASLIGVGGAVAGALEPVIKVVSKITAFFAGSAVSLIVFVPGSLFLNYMFAELTYGFIVIAAMLAMPMVLARALVPEGPGFSGSRLERLISMMVAIVIFPSGIMIGHTAFITILPLASTMISDVMSMIIATSPGLAGSAIILPTILVWQIAIIVRVVFWLSNLGSFLTDIVIQLFGAPFNFKSESENASNVIRDSSSYTSGAVGTFGKGANVAKNSAIEGLSGGNRVGVSGIHRNSPGSK